MMADTVKSWHPFLDYVQLAFILTDSHSKIIYANRYTERVFGYRREEIEGERIRILFLEEDLTYFLPNIIYLTLYRGGFEGDALLRQSNGERIFTHLSTASFKEEGEVFLTFSIQEIQRLKRMEKEKLEMEHRANLGMMVEEIAHQVRNPILSIGGYAQRLIQASKAVPKNKVYLDRILQETGRLETMIRQMEDVIKIQNPVFQKENVPEIVEGALQAVSHEQVAKGVTFSLEARALKGDEHFYVDRGLVNKALMHVFENGMESAGKIEGKKERKKIRVVLACDGENIEITVADKGEGISKKHLHRIFHPFYSTRPERVGLGLTFVKRVIEEHGGRIEVESQLRRGTTVTLTFPKDRRRQVRREYVFTEAGNPFSSPR